MRPHKAGLAFILLLLAALVTAASRADIKGEVESIGFNASYRPNAHTQMIVRLQPQGTETGLYQIQVRQKDLDGDTAVFTRTVSVTGGEGSREQRFWMDFVPQPTGLPDPAYGETLKDLQKQLRVYLYRNGKEVAYLPVTNTINNVDPKPSSFSTRRGKRLVLFVHDGRSMPSWDEYNPNYAQNLLGVLEDVEMMPVRVSELPENPLGYDAVDAVLWLNVDPLELKRNGDAKFRCLETYVRQGGNLVICQSPEWQKTLEFGDLLPVELKGVENRDTIEPLKTLAKSQGPRRDDKKGTIIADPWMDLKGPFQMARAKAKPGAVVDEWISWDDKGKDRTPYIARQPVGLGAVTWVAQDLGDPTITSRAKTGWVFVWDRVFDWHNAPLVVQNYTSPEDKAWYAPGAGVDAGQWLSEGMELPSTVAMLIAVAIAFFLIYWVVAGPGFYVYLLSRRRAQLSWFMFGASALGATLLTVLIVKLVLRGAPELRHTSVVAAAEKEPTLIRSRFGLYIKRDGEQKLALSGTSPEAVSTITAFPMHPVHYKGDAETVAPLEYQVNVRDLGSTDPPVLAVPFRSTLKKFMATWVGDDNKRIEGTAQLIQAGFIGGKLTNGTGTTLRNVYFCFKYPLGEADFKDWLMYKPTWDPGVTLDLTREFNTAAPLDVDHGIYPERGKQVKGLLREMWQPALFNPILKRAASAGMGEGYLNDAPEAVPRSIPILSFFDRLAPMKNENPSQSADRVEILRRGARHLDRSGAIAAGALVVVAQANTPLPMPLKVEGDPVSGEGTTFYQFVVPLDRTTVDAAATQPVD